MVTVHIEYPLGFTFDLDKVPTSEEAVELLTEAIFDWVEHGVKPSAAAITVQVD